MAEIFREKFCGIGRCGGGQDEAVPEGKLVENAAVDAFLDDRRGDLHDVEDAEVAEVLSGLQRLDPELAGGCRVEFLEHLGGNHAGPVLGMVGDEIERRVLFDRVGAIHRIDQDVVIDKAASGHGSVAVKFFTGDLHALGVAG